MNFTLVQQVGKISGFHRGWGGYPENSSKWTQNADQYTLNPRKNPIKHGRGQMPTPPQNPLVQLDPTQVISCWTIFFNVGTSQRCSFSNSTQTCFFSLSNRVHYSKSFCGFFSRQSPLQFTSGRKVPSCPPNAFRGASANKVNMRWQIRQLTRFSLAFTCRLRDRYLPKIEVAWVPFFSELCQLRK